MKVKYHKPEEAIRFLRQAELEMAGGAAVQEVCRRLGINPGTLWRWLQSAVPAGLRTLGDDDVSADINRFHRLRDGLYLGDQCCTCVFDRRGKWMRFNPSDFDTDEKFHKEMDATIVRMIEEK